MQRRDKTVQSTACQDKLPNAKKQTPKRVEAGFQARSNGFLIDKNYLLVYQPYTLPTKTSFLSHTSHSNAPLPDGCQHTQASCDKTYGFYFAAP
ncbi:hypothetical protein [Mediterranea sp. An20]|uniref:hypothetical protein n=1 Tax=Mediterranea sp. An20 TaxID=1965586 RepID=UPI001123DD4E|nr:hypothetical protein [Mediterranea sp. An20]